MFPLILTIVGGIIYHLSQKAAGGASNPWSVLVTAYGAAFAAALLLWWFSPGNGRPPAAAHLAAATMIGLGALAIEAGYFFAYRAGWPVSTTSFVSNLAVTAVLVMVGWLVLDDSFTVARAGGIAMAVSGAWLMMRG